MTDLLTIQQERNEWVAHNFPDLPNRRENMTRSLLGCIEELGELAHADLKQKQGIRGTAEEHEANAKDAVGDALVYLLGVCEYAGFTLQAAVNMVGHPHPLESDGSLFWACNRLGKMCNLDWIQWNAVMQRLVGEFYWALHQYAYKRWDMDAYDLLYITWSEVKKRDWQKNRQDGGEEATGAVTIVIPIHPDFPINKKHLEEAAKQAIADLGVPVD
jgi:NTP pyrophosphatase (non-canonical NTP hydrolase)